MSKKRRSLKVRAELYAAKRMPCGGLVTRAEIAKAWRDAYAQALRDVRRHNPWAPEYAAELIYEVMNRG